MKNLTASGRAGAFLFLTVSAFSQDQQQIILSSNTGQLGLCSGRFQIGKAILPSNRSAVVNVALNRFPTPMVEPLHVIGGKCAMIRPMNDLEKNLGVLCDALPACGELATHCDSEGTEYPLFLCTAHAVEHVLIHGGTVRTEPFGDVWQKRLS